MMQCFPIIQYVWIALATLSQGPLIENSFFISGLKGWKDGRKKHKMVMKEGTYLELV